MLLNTTVKTFTHIILSILFIILFSPITYAKENSISCSNRYLTIVNPIRGRGLWSDRSLKPFLDQYSAIKKFNFPATWLLQYDVLEDRPLFAEIKKIDHKDEKGVFLEISKKLADRAGVVYPINTPWYKPNAVFLSGYTQSDRRKLIDTLFQKFKNDFGGYPESVGAWWIDSYSLNYLKEKYNIKSAMIVASQKKTDNYTVWGQWWGAPYYPSKANILTPASSQKNKQNVVITQWALRDPSRAITAGPDSSNYSLQANDYTALGKDILYFESLSSAYLNCANPVGQITVGLETGDISTKYFREYTGQLEYLSKINNLKAVTLTQFAEKFTSTSPLFPKNWQMTYEDTTISLTQNKFINKKNNSTINYSPDISFADYFLPDKSTSLERTLTPHSSQKEADSMWYLFFLTIAALFFISYKFKLYTVFLISILFSFSAFGLIFKSYYLYGWAVFYGPVVSQLPFTKCLLLIVPFILILILFKIKLVNNKLFVFLIPLSFGLDAILQLIRFSYLSGKYYFGFLIGAFTFAGITFDKSYHINLVKTDLPSYVAGALLNINFAKIWDNTTISLTLYPLIHVFLAFFLYVVLVKFPLKFRLFFITLMILLLAFHLLSIFNSDPRIATKISLINYTTWLT